MLSHRLFLRHFSSLSIKHHFAGHSHHTLARPYSGPMTLKTIYIVRHGYRSDWLAEDEIVYPTGIECDPALAPHGVDQAKELAVYFNNNSNTTTTNTTIDGKESKGSSSNNQQKQPKPKPQLIFSSPFYRCVETAYPTAQALHIPIFLEKGLGEWYKPHRGVIPKPPTIKQLSKFFGDSLSDAWQWDTVVPSLDGEDETDIFHRCQLFWQKFLPKFEQQFPEVETIMLVSHAATKIALGMALLGYQSTRQYIKPEHGGDGETSRIDASTCSLDSYHYNKQDHKWNVNFVGNTDFLSSGDEMGWHFATSRFVAGSKEDIEARKSNGEV